MTIGLIDEFHPVPERPGMRTRGLMATEHGFTSFFVAEFEMDQGAVSSAPHPSDRRRVCGHRGRPNDSTRGGDHDGHGRVRGPHSAGGAPRAS